MVAPLHKLVNNFTQKVAADSTSWGSLAILVCGLGVLLLMMVIYSYSYNY
jgi:uncharacterized membrane-anchored protein